MNRQAGRPSKDNLTPMVSDLDTTRTNEKLGKEVGESREQIRILYAKAFSLGRITERWRLLSTITIMASSRVSS